MYLSLYQGHLCTTDLTVRIEDSMDRLEDGEFFFNRVKLSNYEDDIYDSGMFERTGKVVVSGHYVYPIWKYKKQDKFSDQVLTKFKIPDTIQCFTLGTPYSRGYFYSLFFFWGFSRKSPVVTLYHKL